MSSPTCVAGREFFVMVIELRTEPFRGDARMAVMVLGIGSDRAPVLGAARRLAEARQSLSILSVSASKVF